jgi:hypothetical protein
MVFSLSLTRTAPIFVADEVLARDKPQLQHTPNGLKRKQGFIPIDTYRYRMI